MVSAVCCALRGGHPTLIAGLHTSPTEPDSTCGGQIILAAVDFMAEANPSIPQRRLILRIIFHTFTLRGFFQKQYTHIDRVLSQNGIQD